MKTYLLSFLLVVGLVGWLSAQETPAGEPDIDSFVYVDEEPKPTNLKEVQEKIGYPEAAVDSGIQGQVIVRVLVDESGNYVKHKVVKDVHPLLSAAVESRINELAFTPAKQQGKAIKFWMNIPFSFRMIDKSEEELRQEQIDALTKQIGEDPENYQALLTRGIAYREMNEFEKAVADFTQSISVNPQTNKKKTSTLDHVFFAQFARGTTYSLKKEWQSAVDDFSLALSTAESMKVEDSLVTATLPNVYLERGFSYFQLEQYDAAGADYDQALATGPDRKCDIYSLKSELSLAQEDYPSVIEAMDHLIECTPESPYLVYSRGYYKTKAEDFEGAIADFEHTVENNSNPLFQIASLNLAAWSHMKLGNKEKAYEVIAESLNRNVLNAQTYYYRALIRLEDDKAGEACSDLADAIDYGLEGEELEKAEILLKEKCGGEK